MVRNLLYDTLVIIYPYKCNNEKNFGFLIAFTDNIVVVFYHNIVIIIFIEYPYFAKRKKR